MPTGGRSSCLSVHAVAPSEPSLVLGSTPGVVLACGAAAGAILRLIQCVQERTGVREPLESLAKQLSCCQEHCYGSYLRGHNSFPSCFFSSAILPFLLYSY